MRDVAPLWRIVLRRVADDRDQTVRSASGLLRQNLAETRSLVHVLASPGLETAPLPDAAPKAASQYLPGVHLVVTGEPRPGHADTRRALLRVVQSAAENTALHASAADATVTLGFLPGSVTLDVQHALTPTEAEIVPI